MRLVLLINLTGSKPSPACHQPFARAEPVALWKLCKEEAKYLKVDSQFN
jgi:hypothetical protein